MTIAFIFRCGRRRCRRGEASGKYRQDERLMSLSNLIEI
jgi:hypothetical protein